MDSKWLKVKITVSVQLQRAINNTRWWIRVLSSKTIQAVHLQSLDVAGQAASVLQSTAALQVFQAKMLTSEEAGLDAASPRDHDRPGPTRH